MLAYQSKPAVNDYTHEVSPFHCPLIVIW